MKKRVCPICDSVEHELLISLSYTFPAEYRDCGKKNIVSCKLCGFIYNIDDEEGKEREVYIIENNRYEGVPSFDHYDPVYDYISGNYQKNANILDVGCGQGFLLRKLKDSGYTNLHGLDPSKYCMEQLRAYGIESRAASLYDTIPEFGGRFDIIIFTDVIEHIERPRDGVKNICSWLKDSGVIYAKAPNVNDYQKDYDTLSELYCAEHINHFTPEYLNNLFIKQGLQCMYSADINNAIIGRYKKTASADIKEYLVNSEEAKASCIRAYKMIAEQKEIVKEYFKNNSGKKAAVWGCSHTFMQMYPEAFENCEISCIIDIDKSKHGLKIDGIEVCSPEYLSSFNGAILVLTNSSRRSILKHINSAGLKHEIIVL